MECFFYILWPSMQAGGSKSGCATCLSAMSKIRTEPDSEPYLAQTDINMKLLHARTKTLRDFLSEEELPPFAILSHTWGKDEVKYAEIQSPVPGTGWQKIDYTCRQAILDGLEWVWVDTCCIDKTSSAELDEAIKSMFRWYQISHVCYAYLADVSVTASQRDEPAFDSDIRKSRWFRRGWTLQELIAPKNVEFYSESWHFIGSKTDLCSLISSVTRIGETYLNGHDILTASVAHRMSWASRRETARKEDIAYCLFGIFDINMPLIYGEGQKAFQRLQFAIMQAHPEDHTLYAWGTVVDDVSWLYPKERALADTTPTWEDVEEREELGLLANSPRDFKDSGLFVPTTFAWDFTRLPDHNTNPSRIGNTTICLDLPVYSRMDYCLRRRHASQIVQLRYVRYVALLCGHEGDFMSTVAIPFEGDLDSLTRTREIVRREDPLTYDMLDGWKTALRVGAPPPFSPQPNDLIFRRQLVGKDVEFSDSLYIFPELSKGRAWKHQRFIRTDSACTEICALSMTLRGQDRGFALCLSHFPNKTEYGSSLSVGLVPFRNRQGAEAAADGLEWIMQDSVWFNKKPTFSHAFAFPEDEWILEVKPLPRIFMRVEKMRLGGGFVDVLDLLVQ